MHKGMADTCDSNKQTRKIILIKLKLVFNSKLIAHHFRFYFYLLSHHLFLFVKLEKIILLIQMIEFYQG